MGAAGRRWLDMLTPAMVTVAGIAPLDYVAAQKPPPNILATTAPARLYHGPSGFLKGLESNRDAAKDAAGPAVPAPDNDGAAP